MKTLLAECPLWGTFCCSYRCGVNVLMWQDATSNNQCTIQLQLPFNSKLCVFQKIVISRSKIDPVISKMYSSRLSFLFKHNIREGLKNGQIFNQAEGGGGLALTQPLTRCFSPLNLEQTFSCPQFIEIFCFHLINQSIKEMYLNDQTYHFGTYITVWEVW